LTTYQPGSSAVLTAEWRMYAGGPLVAVTGVSIAVVATVTGSILLASTSTGVSTPTVGINAYTWSIPANAPDGSYLVTWTGTDSDGDTVTATELITLATPETDYTQLSLVKSQLGKITIDDRDEMIQAAITAASRMIDEECGRWPGGFAPDATTSTRVFPVAGRTYSLTGNRIAILVDDIADSSGVIVQVGTEASAVYASVPAFTTAPANAIALGQAISSIVVSSTVLTTADTVRITARWGYPAVPAQIELATRLQAARLYRRKDSPQGVIASPDFGGIRVSRFDPDVRALLAPFTVPGFA
jgi:hypothetical protein